MLTQEIAAAEQQLAGYESTKVNFIAALNTINTLGDSINDDIKAIVDNQIDEFTIRNISHAGTSLSVNGWAESEEEVMQYARKLDATGRFSEITISSLSRTEASEGEEEEEEEEEESEEDTDDIMMYAINIRL